jgi:hypothetical protein
MNLLREYIRDILLEKTLRKDKDKRTLYHINRFRPAHPQPKMKYMQDWDPNKLDADGDKGTFVKIPGTNNWDRWWMDSPVESGVFLTPNPLDIAMNHGRDGHVYAYKVPEWVIDKSGGLHRYDHGSEILIPEDVWNEAGKEIEFLGKSMTKEELWEKMDSPIYGAGHHRIPKTPSWLSAEQLKQWKKDKDRFNLAGLRATKHPESVIKMLKPEEIKAALTAFAAEESLVDNEKDEQLIDLLKKQMTENIARQYIKQTLLTEAAYTPSDLPSDLFIRIRDEGELFDVAIVKHSSRSTVGDGGSDWSSHYSKHTDIGGELQAYKISNPGSGHCLDAFMVSYSEASDGWGPLLYDIAIEHATKNGSGLIADRESVSDEAKSVWDYYHASRPDVDNTQLDNMKDSFKNGPEDDCDQYIASLGGKNDWRKSSLSKIYKKSPASTIEKLKTLGKLVTG